jgi:hypothetical protein
MTKLRWALTVLALLCCISGAQAAEQGEGTRITDPKVLASMGLPADAVGYLAPGARLGQTADLVDDTKTYGSAAIQVAHAGVQFQGRQSTYAYNTGGGVGDVSYVSGDTFTDAALHLPNGAIWDSTRLWANDANAAADIGFFLFQACQPTAGPGAVVFTILGSGLTTGSAGNQSLVVTVAPTTTIDNNACHYWVRARFDAAGLILQKARTQFRLQVSAAPAVATFPNDVPTTHPFFRFVEAMAASGLTGGCGTGSYCPDTAVTRGQMAVFLSTALGLHFPN